LRMRIRNIVLRFSNCPRQSKTLQSKFRTNQSQMTKSPIFKCWLRSKTHLHNRLKKMIRRKLIINCVKLTITGRRWSSKRSLRVLFLKDFMRTFTLILLKKSTSSTRVATAPYWCSDTFVRSKCRTFKICTVVKVKKICRIKPNS